MGRHLPTVHCGWRVSGCGGKEGSEGGHSSLRKGLSWLQEAMIWWDTGDKVPQERNVGPLSL